MGKKNIGKATERQLGELVRLLAENATVVVSGTRIAKEFGVTRSTVWKWVTRLRRLGVKVQGRAAAGYFLEAVPDVLLPEILQGGLRGSIFGKRVIHFFRTDSTNRVALELGHAGEPEGAVVVAEEQTAGRGRAGRSWVSERGTGIYLTLLLRPRIAPVQAPLLTMMAGISARAAVQAVTGLSVDLKWPNDLLIGGKKVGGILTEMHAEPTAVKFVIVGIGVNVNQETFPAEICGVATSLRVAGGKRQSRVEILLRLLREFEADYSRFVLQGSAAVVDKFSEISSYARGKRVRVTTGTEIYTGVTAGLTPEGLLRVERGDGAILTVIAGDVTAAK
jgi:BirA family transcriptional regulator, biotin operon repressor / biotin---[acetyl-CoA-carboxylase] ligase